VELDSFEKVDVSRVLIQRVDGLPSKARVSSLDAANAVLERWADCAPETGHDQCDLQIVFEDGFRYREHYHLRKTQKRISLARHVRKRLKALATVTDTKKAAQSVNEPVISLIGADPAESAKIALDHYNI
jgi:hypothetical protein